jgi:hypothetical protein
MLIYLLILLTSKLKAVAMNLSTNFKFKVYPKKLSSGKCQVRFIEKTKGVCGYALVDSKVTLKEVIEHLDYQLSTRMYKPYFLNSLISGGEDKGHLPIDYLIFNQ